MVQVRCQKCNRILESPNWNQLDTCKDCGGYFIPNQPIQPSQPFNPSLSNQLNEIPNTFNQIPHVIVGKKPVYQNQIPNYQPNQNITPYPIKNDKEWLQKVKDYVLYGLIAAIAIFALWRIILSFF